MKSDTLRNKDGKVLHYWCIIGGRHLVVQTFGFAFISSAGQ